MGVHLLVSPFLVFLIGLVVFLSSIPELFLLVSSLDVVLIHDLLDRLVVLKDGQSWHVFNRGQLAQIPDIRLDELVSCIAEGCPIETLLVLLTNDHLLGVPDVPVIAQTVVELVGSLEVTTDALALGDFSLFVVGDSVEVEVVFVHGELVVADCLSCFDWVDWSEILLVYLVHRHTI